MVAQVRGVKFDPDSREGVADRHVLRGRTWHQTERLHRALTDVAVWLGYVDSTEYTAALRRIGRRVLERRKQRKKR